MSLGFGCFDLKTYNEIKRLHRKGFITTPHYHLLEDCRGGRDVEKILSRHFTIDVTSAIRSSLFLYFIDTYPKSEINDRDWKKYPHPVQCWFFNELIRRGGVYSRNDCIRDGVTDYQVKDYIEILEDKKFILCVRTKRPFGRRTIFIIHPEVLQCIK